MPTYVLQVRFPRGRGGIHIHPVASVRRVVAGSLSEADAILRAEYTRRGVAVHSIKSFGRV